MKRLLAMILAIFGFLFLCNPVHADMDDGLVAYYPFNGNANDESGNGNNGTVNGATLTEDRFGNDDSAYSFGGDDYIEADASSLPTAERTVSLWFKTDMVTNEPNLVGYGGDGGCGTSWLMGINHWGNNTFSITSHCGYDTLEYYYSEEPIAMWFHYVITTDSNGTKIFVNGEEKESNSNFIDGTSVIGASLALGVAVNELGQAPYTDGNVGYFIGSMDDVRIYNRALSEDEIQELFNESEDSADYSDGYEAGMQYCIENPEACGIDTGGSGECEDCDLNGDGKVNGRDLGMWVDGCLGAKPE